MSLITYSGKRDGKIKYFVQVNLMAPKKNNNFVIREIMELAVSAKRTS